MALPRVLVAVPILIVAAGLFAPGLTSATAQPKGQHTVGMVQTDFGRDTITLQAGQRLELVNNSNFLHVVTLGAAGKIESERGAPTFGRIHGDGLVVMPRGAAYLTRPWNVPGVFHVTCTIHTYMNLTVVVRGARHQPGRSRLVFWLSPAAAGRQTLAARLADCG